MKSYYSSLKCPHCGASDFKIIKDDIFLCAYCGEKFNYDLDDLKFSNENKIFLEEIKEEFNNKITYLQKEKIKNKALLIYYSKRANSKVFLNITIILGIISSFLFLSGLFSSNFSFFTVMPFAVFVVLHIVSLQIYKFRYKKYYSISSLYASRIVEIDEEIGIYSKLISKLT